MALTRQQREEKYRNFTGWSNDSIIRSYQERWWSIYVSTGEVDRPSQERANELAEKRRKQLNASYKGGDKDGPSNREEADRIVSPILRDKEDLYIPSENKQNTPEQQPTIGPGIDSNLLTYGLIGLGMILLLGGD